MGMQQEVSAMSLDQYPLGQRDCAVGFDLM